MSESGKVESFKCDNCGAPIDYDGRGEKTVKCGYCGSIQPVPVNLLPPAEPFRVSVQPVQYQFTPTDRKIAKATVATGAGCVLGSVLLPLVILGVTAIIILVVMNNVSNIFNTATSNMKPQLATVSALSTAAKAAKSPTPIPSPTRAVTPTPGYAIKVMSFGSKGTSQGKLSDVRGMGVDSQGNIYVADYSGGRVQVFDKSGQYVSQFKTGNTKSVTVGFAVDAKGTVYVPENGIVVRYNGLTGAKIGPLAYNGGPGAGFAELATTADGGLVAMWYERRNGFFTSREGAREDLVRWDAKGKVTLTVQAPIGNQTDNLELDNAPVVDQKGNIYIYASGENAIFKFSADGTYQSRFGSAGDQPGQFSNANGIAIDSQNMLYVAESSRVSMFTTDGRFIRAFSIQGSANAVVLDAEGNLFVTDGSTVTQYALGQ